MITIGPRSHSGIFLESTSAEAYGVLPGEDRLVKDIMSSEVAPVNARTSVKEAVETLRNLGLPILIVCQDAVPVVALTEYDVAISGADSEDRSGSATLHDIMKQRTAIRCREDAILADAIRAMIDHRARHIPVVDEKCCLVGALSLVDAIAAMPPDTATAWLAKTKRSTVSYPRSHDTRA